MTTSANPFGARAKAEPARQVRSAEQYLDSGASVAAKWPKVGHVFDGDVIGWSPTEVQMTDKETGEPLYWEGKKKVIESKLRFPETSKLNPAMQITMDFQSEATGYTWESNRYIRRELPEDDGVRTAYVHGELAKAMRKGRQEAARKYKLDVQRAPLEVGAHARIVRTDDKKFANDYFGFTYSCVWTPAAYNPAYQEQMMGATEGPGDDSPWAETDEERRYNDGADVRTLSEDDEPPF
jgi:hypothetical protein